MSERNGENRMLDMDSTSRMKISIQGEGESRPTSEVLMMDMDLMPEDLVSLEDSR
jgi:uncharacterized protein (UPF0216 family)